MIKTTNISLSSDEIAPILRLHFHLGNGATVCFTVSDSSSIRAEIIASAVIDVENSIIAA